MPGTCCIRDLLINPALEHFSIVARVVRSFVQFRADGRNSRRGRSLLLGHLPERVSRQVLRWVPSLIARHLGWRSLLTLT